MNTCPFCNFDSMTNNVLLSDKNIPCNRLIFENKYCYSVLKPEQHTPGEALVILRKHFRDISDNISPEELSHIIIAAQKISRVMKCDLFNSNGFKPDKIYVSTLCDGIKHFHFHLMPRYPFTESDKKTFIRSFLQRDGSNAICRAISSEELGGFWYISEREKTFKESDYWKLGDSQKVTHLKNLAACLRNKLN